MNLADGRVGSLQGIYLITAFLLLEDVLGAHLFSYLLRKLVICSLKSPPGMWEKCNLSEWMHVFRRVLKFIENKGLQKKRKNY